MMKLPIKQKHLYYIISILICLLLIAGLVHILTEESKTQIEEEEEPVKKEEPVKVNHDKIRVLIKTNGFAQEVHPSVKLSSGGGLIVHYGKDSKELAADEVLQLKPNDPMFKSGSIVVEPKDSAKKITIHSLKRGYGKPSYRGNFELFATSEGIAVVNELLLEEYLYAVVPSEMPSAYDPEALKVQAVCARSYAYCQMEDVAYPEYKAYVDDSVSYQVYGNSKEAKSATQAVKETTGEKVLFQDKVVKTYYFSTSCGKTTSIKAWGTKETKKNGYLRSAKVSAEDGCYEKDLPWFSWVAKVPVKTMSNLIGLNTGTNVGTVKNIEVTKRGPGDIALEIKVTGSKGSVTVKTENKIRRALGGSGYQITKQDKSVVDSAQLLPSAFFSIEKKDGKFVITGGGFGHGIGMSQNGANEMAKAGKNYIEILQLFYKGVEVKAQ